MSRPLPILRRVAVLCSALLLASACGNGIGIAIDDDGGIHDAGHTDSGTDAGDHHDAGQADGGGHDGGSADGGSGSDAGEQDGGTVTDGGSGDHDGGTTSDGGTTDGGTVTDGGSGDHDGGTTSDGGSTDGGTVTDGGSNTDGGTASDGGTVTDGGTTDGGTASDGGTGCDLSNHHICAISGTCAPDDSTSSCGTAHSTFTFCHPCTGSSQGTAYCDNGTCRLHCNSGYHDCSILSVDYCADDTSPSSCGASCNACPDGPANSHATCAQSTCGWACNDGYHLCGNQCIAVSASSCGPGCNICPASSDPNATAVCTNDGTGACGTQCKDGWHRCGGSGTCSQAGVNSCGDSCAVCSGGQGGATAQCYQGACVTVCPSPKMKTASNCGTPTAVAATYASTCAVVSGEIRCFGANDNGQLGASTPSNNNTGNASSVPIGNPSAPTSPIGLSMSEDEGCAIDSSNKVFCWNSTGTHYVTFASTTTVKQVVSGSHHHCVLTTGNGVKCWGDNTYGQLGNNTTTGSTTPVDAVGLTSAVLSIAAGGDTSCAILNGGALRCWGYNSDGEVGDNTTVNKLIPTDVFGFTSGAAQVAVGQSHTCAVLSGGGVKCWGDDTEGQLGDAAAAGSESHVPVNGPTLSATPTQLALGYRFSCAIVSGGVKCWGSADWGQVGSGSDGNYHEYTPLTVVDASSGTSVAITGVTSISAGSGHACAVSSNGLYCWGWNASGQLGDATVLTGNFADRPWAALTTGQ